MFFLTLEEESGATELETWRSLVQNPNMVYFFLRIEDTDFDRMISLTAEFCLDSSYMCKAASGLERMLPEVFFKKYEECIERCSGCCVRTEIM